MKTTTRPLIISVALAASALANANLLLNGGFETGTLGPEWTALPASNANFYVTNEEAYEGSFSMKFANAAGYLDTIQQNVPTTQVGQTYRIEMWVKNYGVGNDALVIEYSGGTVTYSSPVPTGLESWEHVSFEYVVPGDSTNFRVRGFDTISAFYVDNVSLTAVPEPMTLTALGVGALAVMRRRKHA